MTKGVVLGHGAESRWRGVEDALRQVPEANRATVQVVLPVMARQAEGSERELRQVGAVMAPVFLRRRPMDHLPGAAAHAQELEAVNTVLRLLILHCQTILSPSPNAPGAWCS